MTAVPSSAHRRRIALAILAAIVLCAGLAVHRLGSGDAGDIAGDALYAVLAYLLIALVLARRPRSLVAALAIILCTSVELLQLTELPGDAAAAFSPAALVLGRGFDQRDLLVYAFAIVLVMLADVAISRTIARGRRSGRLPSGRRPLR